MIGTYPIDGNHCSVKEKMRIKTIPTTNPGIDNPTEVKYPMIRSILPPGFRIESGARISAKIQANKIIKNVSSSVTGIR